MKDSPEHRGEEDKTWGWREEGGSPGPAHHLCRQLQPPSAVPKRCLEGLGAAPEGTEQPLSLGSTPGRIQETAGAPRLPPSLSFSCQQGSRSSAWLLFLASHNPTPSWFHFNRLNSSLGARFQAYS